MHKGMTIAGSVILGLSLLFMIGGGVLTGSAGEDLENIDDDPSPYYTLSENGSATFAYYDEDGQGSTAFEVLLTLDYVDSDEDGFVDNCRNYTISVTDEDGVDVTENVTEIAFSKQCRYDEWYAEDQMHEGLTVAAFVCETYDKSVSNDCTLYSNYTISVLDENNASVEFTLFDNDAYLIMLIEEGVLAGGTLVGGLGIISVGCCGIFIGLIILIIGLVMSGPQSHPQMMGGQMPMVGAMPANQGTVLTQTPVQSIQPPLSSGATDSSVPDMAAAYAEQFSQPPTE
jgi:hypothetical protein